MNGKTPRHTLWFYIANAAAAIAILAAGAVLFFALAQTKKDATATNAGRRASVSAVCAIQKAVIDAGVTAIKSRALLPGDKLVKGRFVPGPFTDKLGSSYPNYPERVKRVNQAASSYENQISRSLIEAVDVHPPPITGNHLDCNKLLIAANVKR